MSAMLVKAIAPWFGGKRSMAARIARECCQADGAPPKAFWDLCCGSMAVSLAMPHCAHHTAVDLHGDLVNLARVIKDPALGPQFYRRLRRQLFTTVTFREAKLTLAADDRLGGDLGLFADPEERAKLSPLDRAVAFFIVSWQGRNGVAGTERVNYQPCIRWTSGGGAGGVRFANTVASIPAWRRRMRSIFISDHDVFEVLKKIEDQDGTSIYIDPPYLRAGDRSGSCKYEHEFDGIDHVRLAKLLHRFARVRVVVSYYDHGLLREWYPGWTFVNCGTQKNLHVQNRRGVGRCEAPEVLLINGPSFTASEEANT